MSQYVAECAILSSFIWYVELPGTVAFFPVGSIALPSTSGSARSHVTAYHHHAANFAEDVQWQLHMFQKPRAVYTVECPIAEGETDSVRLEVRGIRTFRMDVFGNSSLLFLKKGDHLYVLFQSLVHARHDFLSRSPIRHVA